MTRPTRILYVDDYPLDRELVRDVLEKEHGGFEVVEAASRADFETALAQGGFDLVLSDFNILGFEGLQVLETVRATGSHLPVIIVTGTGSEEIAAEAIKRGAADYVIKSPKHIQHLPHTIHAVLEKKQLENERKQTEDELREKEQLLSEAQSIGHIGSWSYDLSTDTLQFSDEIFRLLNVSSQDFQYDTQSLLNLVYSTDRPNLSKWVEEIRAGNYSKIVDFRIFRENSEMRYIQVRGAFVYGRDGKPIRFSGTAQDITERKLSEIQIRQQMEHLTALRKIDQAIASSKNLKSTLQVVLAEVLKQLQVDAAEILLLSPDGILLKHVTDMGFRTNEIQSAVVRMGEGHAGRAAKERRLIHVENLKDEPDNKLPASLLREENFVCYYGIPLIAKKRVRGVLEIFHRVPLQPYAEWLDFLDLLAGQAAIAIDNAGLFEDLQISNSELTHAYEATIEGWSRALDLRDKETEGHTQRVTEKTLELARLMGLSDDELVHIRRGALLHDIGKMGVPDEILFKADNLSAEEWEIMKKHPIFAYDMLSPIYYIKSAGIDIPYCHHEKWDGTGYPRGLKGEQIPLTARIFAVVDVWDAITSDRPYRSAWTKEKAIEYIKEQSGTHFDPQVVDAFLKLIS